MNKWFSIRHDFFSRWYPTRCINLLGIPISLYTFNAYAGPFNSLEDCEADCDTTNKQNFGNQLDSTESGK